jgi:hypothetical protein
MFVLGILRFVILIIRRNIRRFIDFIIIRHLSKVVTARVLNITSFH